MAQVREEVAYVHNELDLLRTQVERLVSGGSRRGSETGTATMAAPASESLCQLSERVRSVLARVDGTEERVGQVRLCVHVARAASARPPPLCSLFP